MSNKTKSVVAVAAAILATLAGCGGPRYGVNPDGSAASQESLTLRENREQTRPVELELIVSQYNFPALYAIAFDTISATAPVEAKDAPSNGTLMVTVGGVLAGLEGVKSGVAGAVAEGMMNAQKTGAARVIKMQRDSLMSYGSGFLVKIEPLQGDFESQSALAMKNIMPVYEKAYSSCQRPERGKLVTNLYRQRIWGCKDNTGRLIDVAMITNPSSKNEKLLATILPIGSADLASTGELVTMKGYFFIHRSDENGEAKIAVTKDGVTKKFPVPNPLF